MDAGSCAVVGSDAILTGMATRFSSPTFVGRAAQLGLLEDARRRAAAGPSAVVVVGGEAGLGAGRAVGAAAGPGGVGRRPAAHRAGGGGPALGRPVHPGAARLPGPRPAPLGAAA